MEIMSPSEVSAALTTQGNGSSKSNSNDEGAEFSQEVDEGALLDSQDQENSESTGSSVEDAKEAAKRASQKPQQGKNNPKVTKINPLAKGGQGNQPNAQQAALNALKTQFQELLQKNGGLTIKAGGKEHKVESLDSLIRYAQRGIPADRIVQETAQERQKMAQFGQLLQALSNGDAETREKVLERLLPPDALDSLAIARARKKFMAEEEAAKLSPRERQMREQLSKAQSAEQQLAMIQRAYQQKLQEQEDRKHVEAYKAEFEKGITGALDILKLTSPKMNARALSIMRPLIQQMKEAGMALDPQFLADRVKEELTESLSFLTNGLEGDDLLNFLGADVGKRVRKALLSKLQAGQAPRNTTQSSPSERKDKPKDNTNGWAVSKWT